MENLDLSDLKNYLLSDSIKFSFRELISTIFGNVHAKIVTDQIFLENGLMCKKGTILTFRLLKMTFRTIQPNPSYDMLLMSSQRNFMQQINKKAIDLDRSTDFFYHTQPHTYQDEYLSAQMYPN